jgi:hypothetical protein
VRVFEPQPALETRVEDQTHWPNALNGLASVLALQQNRNPVVRQERRPQEPQRRVAIDRHNVLTAS